MHTDSVTVDQPLFRRALTQTLALIGGSVLLLTAVSFVVARHFLLERAQLHVVTLLSVAFDEVRSELTDHADAMANPSVLLSSPAFTERLSVIAGGGGASTEILLGRVSRGDLEIITLNDPENRKPIILGRQLSQLRQGLAIAEATAGQDTVGVSDDYRGVPVVTAATSLPSHGFGLAVQIDASEVFAGVRLLGFFHGFLGFGLLLLAAAGSLWLSRSWTTPVRTLADRVATLGPGHWGITAELRTKDELAFLEGAIVGMAARLKSLYENLEELVTERTQDLREQYELDRAVLDTMEHAVLVTDRNGGITSMNPAAERFTGKKMADHLGESADQLLPLAEKGVALTGDRHPVLQAIRTRASVHPAPGSAWTFGEGTEQKSVYMIATPLVADDTVFGSVTVFQDVTKERQMEQLKSEFITLASHQLRTPLSIVQWQLETLRDEKADQQSRTDALTEVEHAASRMTTITNAMLQVAKLEGGALTPTLSDVDLSAVLKNVTEGVIDGNAHHIQVQLQFPDALHVSTDPVLLASALQSVVENAVKYSPEGGALTILCSAGSGKVRISVSDEGMGIPAAEQRHVFEKFFRGENVKKTSTDGTGLGLYIAKMIVEELGGQISFESKEGKGTTFIVTLPA